MSTVTKIETSELPAESKAGVVTYGGTRGFSRVTPLAPPVTTSDPKTDEIAKSIAEQAVKAFMQANAQVVGSLEEAMALENPKPDVYFMTRKGLACRKTRVLNGNTFTFTDIVTECPLLDTLTPTVGYSIKNKIPKELLIEIIGSFYRIVKRSGDEAAAQIYRKDATGEYFIYYPKQRISSAHVAYDADENLLELRKENHLIMELHSHNTMAAFWSGTDDNNETECGLYMVIGTFGQDSATYKCRVKEDKTYINFPAYTVFDMTPEEEIEIFKKENFSEGNPEIETKLTAPVIARSAGYTFGRYSGDINYSEYYSGRYGDPYGDYDWDWRRARRNTSSTVSSRSNTASYLSSFRWDNSYRDSKTNKYYSIDGYMWSAAGSGWVKDPRPLEEQIDGYKAYISEIYSDENLTGKKFADRKKLAARKLLAYITASESAEKEEKIERPGENIPTSIDPKDFSNTEEFETMLKTHVESRVFITNAITKNMNRPEYYDLEIDANIQDIKDVEFFADSAIMYELFTDNEKIRLAQFFDLTVPEFAKAFCANKEYTAEATSAFYSILCVPKECWPAMIKYADESMASLGFTKETISEFFEILDFENVDWQYNASVSIDLK